MSTVIISQWCQFLFLYSLNFVLHLSLIYLENSLEKKRKGKDVLTRIWMVGWCPHSPSGSLCLSWLSHFMYGLDYRETLDGRRFSCFQQEKVMSALLFFGGFILFSFRATLTCIHSNKSYLSQPTHLVRTKSLYTPVWGDTTTIHTYNLLICFLVKECWKVLSCSPFFKSPHLAA